MSWEKPVKKPVYRINVFLLIAIVGIAVVVVPYGVNAVLQYQKNLTTSGISGSIGIETYSDAAATQVINTIDWGTVAPSSTVNKVVYIKNTQNVPVSLSCASNWPVPNQAQYFVYLDNYNDQVIQPGAILPVTFGVQAAANLTAVPTWGFSILITATQIP